MVMILTLDNEFLSILMKRGPIIDFYCFLCSAGEMIVGPMKTHFMDEISTGLDSSTTFQIVRYLRDISHVLEHTMVVSLLQPAPETYDLFDDVILLSDGQVVYHGPIHNILGFFESCGFRCPDRKGVADFLQEVTSRKDQEQYWADRSKPYEFVPVRVFAAAFAKSPDGVRLSEELSKPMKKSETQDGALAFDRFTLSTYEMVKINFDKEWLLMKRNSFIYIFKSVQV
jgi:ABC-type multidrug transport system ATPase subunit